MGKEIAFQAQQRRHEAASGAVASGRTSDDAEDAAVRLIQRHLRRKQNSAQGQLRARRTVIWAASDALLHEALAADDSVEVVDGDVSVLQYNSPLTVLWRRRNEVAIVVQQATTPTAEEGEEAGELQQADVDDQAPGAQDEVADGASTAAAVVSWYDSGKRLS